MPTLASPVLLSLPTAPVADGAAQPTGGGGFTLLILALPILLIVFMIFSQRRRAKQMQEMQSSMNVGDEVMTTTGLHARIAGLGDSVVHLEISPGTVVTWDRRGVVPRPGVAAAAAAEPEPDGSHDDLPTTPPSTPPAGGTGHSDLDPDGRPHDGYDDDPRPSRGE